MAAALDPGVANERIQAWGRQCNWNDILAIARRVYPDHGFVDDLAGMAELSIDVDCSRALGLLGKWAGKKQWTALEATVKDNIDGVIRFTA